MLAGQRLLLAVAPLVLAGGLAACGGSSGNGSAEQAASATTAAPATSAAAPAASGASSTAAAGAVHVKLLSFTPDTIHVKAGTTVEWTDDNPITHTVTSGTFAVGSDGLRTSEQADGAFDGKLATTGSTFSHTFATAGTFTYYCTIHKGMNATVVVDP